jgi:hypothetical protein
VLVLLWWRLLALLFPAKGDGISGWARGLSRGVAGKEAPEGRGLEAQRVRGAVEASPLNWFARGLITLPLPLMALS